jgi:hypothetical protein
VTVPCRGGPFEQVGTALYLGGREIAHAFRVGSRARQEGASGSFAEHRVESAQMSSRSRLSSWRYIRGQRRAAAGRRETP